jgi:hypothetical protein
MPKRLLPYPGKPSLLVSLLQYTWWGKDNLYSDHSTQKQARIDGRFGTSGIFSRGTSLGSTPMSNSFGKNLLWEVFIVKDCEAPRNRHRSAKLCQTWYEERWFVKLMPAIHFVVFFYFTIT